jgi:hypothetical protein
VARDLVTRHRRNLVISRRRRPPAFGDVQERPVDSSRSSRARRTAEERSRAPSLE